MSIQALILDYGGVLSLPQSHERVAAMARLLESPVDDFERAYHEYRDGYDAGVLHGVGVLGTRPVPPSSASIEVSRVAGCLAPPLDPTPNEAYSRSSVRRAPYPLRDRPKDQVMRSLVHVALGTFVLLGGGCRSGEYTCPPPGRWASEHLDDGSRVTRIFGETAITEAGTVYDVPSRKAQFVAPAALRGISEEWAVGDGGVILRRAIAGKTISWSVAPSPTSVDTAGRAGSASAPGLLERTRIELRSRDYSRRIERV